MPITQLMQKLSGRFDSRLLRTSNSGASAGLDSQRSTEPMDCSTSFEVVAEVMAVTPGSSHAGSLCSASSHSDGAVQSEPDTGSPRQATGPDSKAHLASSSSAALLASSMSGSLPALLSTGSRPATERALRARGKALLRTESGLAHINPSDLDLQHQLSLESSSSMLDTPGPHSLSYGSAGANLSSPRYFRSSTAPSPGSLQAATAATGGLAAQEQAQLPLGPVKSFVRAAAPPEVTHAEEEEEEGDDELVHPLSTTADAEEEHHPEHCHWEDGVIASWLQDLDHAELLHPGDDEDDDAALQQPAVAEHTCSKAAAATGSDRPNTVYSSLLYN